MIEDLRQDLHFFAEIQVCHGVVRSKALFRYLQLRQNTKPLLLLLKNVFGCKDLFKICIFLSRSQRRSLETIKVQLSSQIIQFVMQEPNILRSRIILSGKKFLMVLLDLGSAK